MFFRYLLFLLHMSSVYSDSCFYLLVRSSSLSVAVVSWFGAATWFCYYSVESVRVVWSEQSPPPDPVTSPALFDHPKPVRIQRNPTTSINNRFAASRFRLVLGG